MIDVAGIVSIFFSISLIAYVVLFLLHWLAELRGIRTYLGRRSSAPLLPQAGAGEAGLLAVVRRAGSSQRFRSVLRLKRQPCGLEALLGLIKAGGCRTAGPGICTGPVPHPDARGVRPLAKRMRPMRCSVFGHAVIAHAGHPRGQACGGTSRTPEPRISLKVIFCGWVVVVVGSDPCGCADKS